MFHTEISLTRYETVKIANNFNRQITIIEIIAEICRYQIGPLRQIRQV